MPVFEASIGRNCVLSDSILATTVSNVTGPGVYRSKVHDLNTEDDNTVNTE
jgi:hypothetical protein